MNLNIKTQQSIDALMNELKQVVEVAEDDRIDILDYIIAVKKDYPNATYKIWKDEEGRPYIYDENLGYMVFTEVTIEGETLGMWLPVMDSSNKAMKSQPYEIQTKYKTITVKAATMFDINKTIMRCLVKNLAMFGLGLYIYAGEDIPEAESDDVLATQDEKDGLKASARKQGVSLEWLLNMVGFDMTKEGNQMTAKQYAKAMQLLNRGVK